MSIEEIITRSALIEYGTISDDEIVELFVSLISYLKELPENERKKYRSLYWKLSFKTQNLLGFVSKKETLEAGSKKDIRKKQNYDN